MRKRRLDQALVDAGLAPSRERAMAMVLAGVVLVDDVPSTKPGMTIKPDATIRVKSKEREDWVGRGALKLQPALTSFRVSASGRTALDIGASTGGFTEVMLRAGATKVYAVDVGYNQLAWRLRNDERVVVRERTNARNLSPDDFDPLPSLCTVDVSFISVRLILPVIQTVVAANADVLVMVKPQFEVAKGRVGKGGVVRDEALRQEAVQDVITFAESLGFRTMGRRDNDIRGPKGNLETFVHFQRVAVSTAVSDGA